MSTFDLGCHLPNYEDLTEDDYAKLRAMRPDVLGSLYTPGTKHRRSVYERIERECGKVVWIVRVGPSGKTTPRTWHRDAEAALLEVPPLAFTEGRVRLRCLNEVNLPEEGGWAPEEYAAFLHDCSELLRDDVPLVAAPISLGRNGWQEWLARFVVACGGSIPADRIAVNCYQHLVGEAPFFAGFGRPVDVTEISTLGLSGRERGRWIVDRCRELAAAGIESAQAFIVGGKSFGAWDERYVISQEEAEEIGRRGPIEVAQPAQETPMPTREQLVAHARAAAEREGFPADVFVRQINQESGWQVDAGSPAGALGIAQIVPQYHPDVDPLDPFASLDYAARWMGQLFRSYGNIVLPLVHYNGGGGAVEAYRSGEPYDESVRYADAIVGDVCVAQFGGYLAEHGFSPEAVKSACGPIALAGQMYGLGIPGTPEGVMQIARGYGWDESAGMSGFDPATGTRPGNGPANFAAMAGACWVGETSLSADEVAGVLWDGRFVVISTPAHYYLAQRPSRTDDELYVGNTGRSRIGGGPWMSLARIIELDGALNGIFVGGRLQVATEPEPAPVVDELTAALSNVHDLTLSPGPHSEERRIAAQLAIGTIKTALGR